MLTTCSRRAVRRGKWHRADEAHQRCPAYIMRVQCELVQACDVNYTTVCRPYRERDTIEYRK